MELKVLSGIDSEMFNRKPLGKHFISNSIVAPYSMFRIFASTFKVKKNVCTIAMVTRIDLCPTKYE